MDMKPDNRSINRRTFIRAAACAALPAALPAWAQAWPDKPLRMVIPFPPGGPVDAAGRVIAQALGDALGQAVVIDNRSGAGGSVGVEAVAKSPPDGYTMIFGSTGALSVNISLIPNLGYDTRRDLVPISVVMAIPLLLGCRAALPAQDLAGLIAMARAKPGSITVGTTGVGSPAHLMAEMMRQRAGIDFTVIHYRGAAPAMMAMLANEVDLSFLDPAVMMTHVKSGKMRGLATTSRARNPTMANLPTLVEAGMQGVQMENWYALLVPAATPPERIRRLRTAVSQIVAKPGMFDNFISQGATMLDLGPEEGAAFIRREIETWSEVVRAAKMTAN